MSSERKITANRENARRSTGPRTAAGKERVSRNALRHGLARSILADPLGSADVERLARVLADKLPRANLLEAARIAAEAELEILRVRTTQAALINVGVAHFENRPRVAAVTQEEMAARPPHATSSETDVEIAAAVLRLAPQLGKLDRYERRALSRRNRAILEFVRGTPGSKPAQ